MSETFDPYRKWLGIPAEEQPPNFYRLLGLAVFESDTDAISHAADRQMAHLRTFANGRYAALSQKLLNEISTARVCLLDPTKKPQYDAMLRGLGYGAPSSPSPAPPPTGNLPHGQLPVAIPIPPQRGARPMPIASSVPSRPQGELPFDPNEISPARTASHSRPLVHARKTFSAVPLIIGGFVLIVILGIVAYVVNSPPKPDASKATTANAPNLAAARKGGEKEADAKTKGKEPANDKEREGDKDSERVADKTKAASKGTSPGSASSSKPSDAIAEKSTAKGGTEKPLPDKSGAAEKKGDKTVSQKTDSIANVKKSDKSNSSDTVLRIPPIPMTPEGEMPDFGPLQPSESNDTALELAAMEIPSAAAVRAVFNEMRAEWKEALSNATSREEKIDFVQKLVTQGVTSKGTPPRHFAFLKAALGLAIESGDAPTFLKVCETIGENFAVDVWDAKAKAFQNAGGATATPDDLLPIIPICEKTVRAAVAAEKFNAASRIAQAGVILATRAKAAEAVKKFERSATEAATVVLEKDAADKALQTLTERRSDPKANLIYGSYLCFVRGNWQKGNLHLRQGDDEDIRQAAELELKNPFDAQKHRELGDAWLDIAKKFTGLKQSEILKHAKFWYDRALPSLPDEEKAKVEERLKELRESLGD